MATSSALDELEALLGRTLAPPRPTTLAETPSELNPDAKGNLKKVGAEVMKLSSVIENAQKTYGQVAAAIEGLIQKVAQSQGIDVTELEASYPRLYALIDMDMSQFAKELAYMTDSVRKAQVEIHAATT